MTAIAITLWSFYLISCTSCADFIAVYLSNDCHIAICIVIVPFAINLHPAVCGLRGDGILCGNRLFTMRHIKLYVKAPLAIVLCFV